MCVCALSFVVCMSLIYFRLKKMSFIYCFPCLSDLVGVCMCVHLCVSVCMNSWLKWILLGGHLVENWRHMCNISSAAKWLLDVFLYILRYIGLCRWSECWLKLFCGKGKWNAPRWELIHYASFGTFGGKKKKLSCCVMSWSLSCLSYCGVFPLLR